MGGINLHDVPEDRIASNLDHRLGTRRALFGNARAIPARQNDGFHACSSGMKYSASMSRFAATILGPSGPGKSPLLHILGTLDTPTGGWAIVDSEPKADVENLVAPLTDSTNPWHAMAREILAYADYRAGATRNALNEYRSLASDSSAPSQLRVRCDWMATFLKAGGDKNYGTVPVPPPLAPQQSATPPQTTSPSPPQGAAGGPSRK